MVDLKEDNGESLGKRLDRIIFFFYSFNNMVLAAETVEDWQRVKSIAENNRPGFEEYVKKYISSDDIARYGFIN